MKAKLHFLCLVLALLAGIQPASSQTLTTLISFPNNPDGNYPNDSLIQSGSILYGTANSGGAGGHGTVFAVNTNGTGFTTLYAFTNGTDGASPDDNLALLGDTLYGTTQNGGAAGGGTVFSVTTNGANFKILYTFTNGTDGAYPVGGLLVSGNMLYGTAQNGGANGDGTVFAVSTNGTVFTNIVTFNGNNGQSPEDTLILSGDMLYGTAAYGGSAGYGTVFAVSTNGTGFTNLCNFQGGSGGANPYGGLVLSGNTLYGTTENGGAANIGVIFAVNTDSTGFTNLYVFTAPAGANYPYTNSDGATPYGGLVISGGTLYGMTSIGGSAGYGTVFSVSTSGLNFMNLHNFTNASDGSYPQAGFILSGNTLYGTAQDGGSGGVGTIFAIKTDGTDFGPVYGFTLNEAGSSPEAGILVSGYTLYGTAYSGGSGGYGTVFAVNSSGAGLTNVYSFTNGTDGSHPEAALILSGSTLYGTAYQGGSSNYGTVFAVNTNGTGFRTVYSFTNGTDGAYPEGSLTLSGGTLYGTAYQGGSANDGTVFAINTNGLGFTTLYAFTNGADGANPACGLVLSGNILYGTTSSGGINNKGNVFAVNTSGTLFTNVHNFAGPPNDGAFPQSGLTLSGNTLYGTTQGGGVNNDGAVFSLNTSGKDYTNLYSFTGGSDGYGPPVGLSLLGNNLYGIGSYGGVGGGGLVFAVNIESTNFTILYSFTNNTSGGYYPYAALAISGNTLYGTTQSGGTANNGTVFSLNLSGFVTIPPQLYINRSGTNVILSWANTFSDFTLLDATNLLTPVVWSTNLTTPVIVNGQYTVTNAITSPRQFYQLIH